MKKTVLFIITKSETGGAQKFVSEQIQALSSTGKWHCLLATNKKGWLTETVQPFVNESDLLVNEKLEKLYSFYYLFELIKFILRVNPDLIIANSANAGVYGRIAGLLTHTKVIYVSHGWSSIYNGGKLKSFFNFSERILSYISNSILCISDTDRLKAIEIIKIPSSKLKVIPNSILPPKVEYTNYQADLVTVCRLSSPKRVDLLIQAMFLLPEYTLDIIGDGPLFLELQSLATANQSTNIRFMGEKPGFADFSQYKVFCLISDSEGMPMSAIEAMSCGLPLILSDVGGCNELISSNGSLVHNSLTDIAQAIKNTLQNHHHLSLASKQLFDSKFNLDITLKDYENFYSKLISS